MIIIQAVLIKYMLRLSEFSLSSSYLFRNIPIQYIAAPAERIWGLGMRKGKEGRDAEGVAFCPKCPMVDLPLSIVY